MTGESLPGGSRRALSGRRGRPAPGIRRPVLTLALITLALLLSGGGFGLWQYNQGKYFVGVQDGYVAIFSGASHGGGGGGNGNPAPAPTAGGNGNGNGGGGNNGGPNFLPL